LGVPEPNNVYGAAGLYAGSQSNLEIFAQMSPPAMRSYRNTLYGEHAFLGFSYGNFPMAFTACYSLESDNDKEFEWCQCSFVTRFERLRSLHLHSSPERKG
jgi:hypothetical protein